MAILVAYALLVFLPGVVSHVLLEVKGSGKLWRNVLMLTSWYLGAASLLLNLFVIGYVLLYANCPDQQSKDDCKSGLGGKIGVCLILMTLQSATQFYLARVTTWFYLDFEKDQLAQLEKEERIRSQHKMKKALVGYRDGPAEDAHSLNSPAVRDDFLNEEESLNSVG